MSSRGGARDGAGRPKGEETTMVRVPNGCLEAVRSLITDHRNGLSTSLQVQVYDWRPLTERPDLGRKIVVWHGDDYQFAEHALNAEWLLHNLDNNKVKHIKAWCYQHPITPPDFD
ncbi:hypothetical protein [Aeromonas veronii]|uniref:hypothetical protein n=1 Tax=Aeromonas veronii TaxID=654 RepID=UPI0018F26AB6|nr:hypothetical protein [Aeromonas veronii]MBJ7583092.1 hypothetical protein [Aeromonas veronii]